VGVVCAPYLRRFNLARTAGRAPHLEMWAHQARDKGGNRPGIKASVRWLEGYERLAEMAPQLPGARLVYLADHEADMMELMRRAGALGTPVDWLLRSRHNRTLSGGDKLWSAVAQSEPLAETRFLMASRQGQRTREVRQQVWVQTLERPDGKGRFVQASCIVVKETAPAPDDKPVEWRLLTNLPVQSLEQAARMIDSYRSRWEIEMFFHGLRNSCRIKALQIGCIEIIISQGIGHIAARLPDILEDANNELSGAFRLLLKRLRAHLKVLDTQGGELDLQIQHRPHHSQCAGGLDWQRQELRQWPAARRMAGGPRAPSALQRRQADAAGHQQAWRRLPAHVTDPGGAAVDPGRPKQGRAGQRLARQGARATKQERSCRCAGQQERPNCLGAACQGPPIRIGLPSPMRLGSMKTSPGPAM